MKNWILLFALILVSCSDNPEQKLEAINKPSYSKVQDLIVLGTAQDAGYPQVGCQKSCCAEIMNTPEKGKMVSCISVVDHQTKTFYIFDATPDFRSQYNYLKSEFPSYELEGIFLTHAHIGHYTGLMQLGREVMGTKEVKVYAMPRMKQYLEENGPWSQLVQLKNIVLLPLNENATVSIGSGSIVMPFLVPHRDEFSETVGFNIQSKRRKALFIPDINKWELWKTDVKQLVNVMDYAFLDATFYHESELPGRNMAEIPHPFVIETKALFNDESEKTKSNIYFIHLNHTNNLLRQNSTAYQQTIDDGFQVAEQFQVLPF